MKKVTTLWVKDPKYKLSDHFICYSV